MPINNINKPALRSLAQNLVKQAEQDPSAKVGEKQLDEILATVGDRWFTSSDSLRSSFARGMSTDDKLALAKRGLDSSEKADLKALVTDPGFAAIMDPAVAAHLSTLAGVAFAGTAGTGSAPAADASAGTAAPARVSNMTFTDVQLEAVKKFKDLHSSGKLRQYYDAATGAVDNAALKTEAMELFKNLPPMSPTSNAEAFVAAGLWASAPKGLDALEKSARYLPGRQVLVKTTVHPEVFDDRDFLSYKPASEGGKEAITYRATIAGEEGDNFLIKVDGKADPLSVPKAEIYNLNQPHDTDALKTGEHTYKVGGGADYDDPFMKAKVAEAALDIADIVEDLDYTKMSTGGMIGGFGRKTMVELQRKAVKGIHDVIDMKYPKGDYSDPGRSRGGGAGRQAMKGIGVCFDQGGVMLAMLMPFAKPLGLDVQFISGGVYRNVRSRGQNPFSGGAHGWLQVTYRPSMEMRIVDRTWQQADHPADRAYSRWGDRYPAGHYWGMKTKPVTDTDVNMSISTQTFDRQFGEQGRDGRDNHMSLHQ